MDSFTVRLVYTLDLKLVPWQKKAVVVFSWWYTRLRLVSDGGEGLTPCFPSNLRATYASGCVTFSSRAPSNCSKTSRRVASHARFLNVCLLIQWFCHNIRTVFSANLSSCAFVRSASFSAAALQPTPPPLPSIPFPPPSLSFSPFRFVDGADDDEAKK